MMICHCSMAGTQACKNCPRYREYFGEPKNTTNLEIDREWLKEVVREEIAKVIEKESADMRGEE